MTKLIKQSETMVGVAGKDSYKVSLKKTLIQNDGFKTLEIVKNAEQALGLRTIRTTADIFVRDSIDEIQAMIKDTSYAMICNRSHEPKFFDTIEKTIGQIQRALQTQDYRNRDHLVVILRHAPNPWNNKEHFSVYSQDRQFL